MTATPDGVHLPVVEAAARSAEGVTYRPATAADVPACARVLKAAIDGYAKALNQPPMPDDLGPVERILAHTQRTDPERFWVAVRPTADPGAEAGAEADVSAEVVGFGSAYVRGSTWFLAALMVAPGVQASGVGSALMDRTQAARDVAPGEAVPGPDDPMDSGITAWGMSTDALQPISNALYARRGIIARVPAWRMTGEVRRWSAFPPVPASMRLVPFEAEVDAEAPGGPRPVAELVAELDRELLGYEHPQDHGWMRNEGRLGFLLVDRVTGAPQGYAYGAGSGRVGPVAALDPSLHAVLLGVAIRETPVIGPVAVWILGSADAATRVLLEAGLRYDGAPGLFCWSTDDHPFRRYLPAAMAII